MPNKLIEEIDKLYKLAISEKPEGFSLDYGCNCCGGPSCSETDYINKISNAWPQLKRMIEEREEMIEKAKSEEDKLDTIVGYLEMFHSHQPTLLCEVFPAIFDDIKEWRKERKLMIAEYQKEFNNKE